RQQVRRAARESMVTSHDFVSPATASLPSWERASSLPAWMALAQASQEPLPRALDGPWARAWLELWPQVSQRALQPGRLWQGRVSPLPAEERVLPWQPAASRQAWVEARASLLIQASRAASSPAWQLFLQLAWLPASRRLLWRRAAQISFQRVSLEEERVPHRQDPGRLRRS